MQSVAILRQLWRARTLVAVGVAVALVIQIVMTYHVGLAFPPSFSSRQYEVGVGSAGLLLDSRSSQVVDVSGGQNKADVASLSTRALLLANLMATGPLKEKIAARAGIAPQMLLTVPPSSIPGVEAKPLPSGGHVKPDDRRARVLTLYVNESLPIITAASQAPTPVEAARLSSAAVTEADLYLDEVAGRDRVPEAQQLVATPLGAAQSATQQRGPRRLFALIASIFVLLAWCASIIVGARLKRNWREADDDESYASGAPQTKREPSPESPAMPAQPTPLRALAAPEPSDLPALPERPVRRR